MTAPTPTTAAAERCGLRHPGMDVQCGLPRGHRGEHTTEIPNTMPWAGKDLEQWFRDLEDDDWGDAVEAIRAALLAARRENEETIHSLRERLSLLEGVIRELPQVRAGCSASGRGYGGANMTGQVSTEKARQNERGLCAGIVYGDGRGGEFCSRKATQDGPDGYRYCWQHVPRPRAALAATQER